VYGHACPRGGMMAGDKLAIYFLGP